MVRCWGAQGPSGSWKCRIWLFVGKRAGVREEGACTKYFPFKAKRDRGGEEEIKKERKERPRGREGERDTIWKKEKDVIQSIDTPRRSHGARPTRSSVARGRAVCNAEAWGCDAAAFSELTQINNSCWRWLARLHPIHLLYQNKLYFACKFYYGRHKKCILKAQLKHACYQPFKSPSRCLFIANWSPY